MSALFNLPPRTTRSGDSALAKKSKKAKQSTAGIAIKGGGSLLERISTITALVEKQLGKYKDDYLAIREEQELIDYIDKCIEAGIVAIDTESGENALDPLQCAFAGFSLKTRNMKAAYIPVGHISYITGTPSDNQLSAEFVREQLDRLMTGDKVRNEPVKIVMFNANYDKRVLKNQVGSNLVCYWDCYIAAKLLNENEPEAGLKPLHKKYIMNGEGDAWSFDKLFHGIPFTHIPIKTGYIYAARDAELTLDLYDFQEPYLNLETCRDDLKGVAWVFRNIEMPIIEVITKMEDRGVALDFKYAQELADKYNAQLKEREEFFYSICDNYKEKIESYKLRMGSNCKLGTPINISSPPQLQILLYDILELKSTDKKNPRGTGEEIIAAIDHPITKAILDYREIKKLLSTYVEKLPEAVDRDTRRIHAKFNAAGTVTGRFSSSDPNLQNIPSHNTDIRKMFVATKGYYFIGGDYSAQEPRIAAHLSQDKEMIKAFKEGKDLYVAMASIVYNLPYDECKEFRSDGTVNKAGKERRSSVKAILLGILYGKGIPAIAEDLNVSVKKAQEIYDSVLKAYPGLQDLMDESQGMARELGYVETAWGRKRRLPDMQLPEYEFSWIGNTPKNFDPLADDVEEFSTEVDYEIQQRYIKLLKKAYGRNQKQPILEKAKAEGINIKDNGGIIAEATRQCVNSRVQGSAADMTKIAMILIDNNKRLNELDYHLLLPVHDELIGEGPIEHAKEITELVEQCMKEAGNLLSVPVKCDMEVTDKWYGESINL